VPTTGTAVAGFQVSYGAFPATIDSMSGLRNPTPATDSSLANGRKYFQINCAVCHGDRAMGDGPATRFGMPGINLTSDVTKARTDGYIFGMIRNGRGLMPPYNRIEEMDRWDVINYLRALQGVSGKAVVVGPLAAPGVTGDKVPGATQLGPNQPAPFYNPRSVLPGAAAQQGAAGNQPAAPSADTSAARLRNDSTKARTDSIRARRLR
jgi:mono/diheme cytochrome c family protein